MCCQKHLLSLYTFCKHILQNNNDEKCGEYSSPKKQVKLSKTSVTHTNRQLHFNSTTNTGN